MSEMNEEKIPVEVTGVEETDDQIIISGNIPAEFAQFLKGKTLNDFSIQVEHPHKRKEK